jgi:hypothetical protein
VQAALTSAASFSVGAAMPLLMVVLSFAGALAPIVSGASLVFLAPPGRKRFLCQDAAVATPQARPSSIVWPGATSHWTHGGTFAGSMNCASPLEN